MDFYISVASARGEYIVQIFVTTYLYFSFNLPLLKSQNLISPYFSFLKVFEIDVCSFP